jgi:hypothetical protein
VLLVLIRSIGLFLQVYIVALLFIITMGPLFLQISICGDGLLDYIINGIAKLHVRDQAASNAIRWGLGFAIVSQGVISSVTISELAVVDCLRQIIPFGNLLHSFVKDMFRFPKPQLVGYLLEYLVAFALVANENPGKRDVLEKISVSGGSFTTYLDAADSTYEVFFPNHCCGPDIVYKHGNIVHLVQVKFFDTICRQEGMKACATTDPGFFYWNRPSERVLAGFQKERDNILNSLKGMTCKRQIFLHTGTKTTDGMKGVEVINEETCPDFFHRLHPEMWKVLNNMRAQFSE